MVLASAFTQKDIVSPAEGSWCNQQALVLNSSNASELYYSLTGANPFESGFAYDGPVLIEKKGDVSVRIGVVESDGKKKEFTVRYNVSSPDYAVTNDVARSFAENELLKSPLIVYYSGTDYKVPDSYRFTFDNTGVPTFAKMFTLCSDNWLERFVPFTITDGINRYHLVIHVYPSEKPNGFEKTSLPFTIRDWTNIKFDDRKFIYQIDGEMWNSNYDERHIDRTRDHLVRFQPVDFKDGNLVREILVPARPKLARVKRSDGSIEFRIKTSLDYSFKNGKKSIVAHVFEGEEVAGIFSPEIYYEGNLQGTHDFDYSIDRCNPVMPEIMTSGKTSISRSSVAVKIKCREKADIYYAVSNPVYFESDYQNIEASDILEPEIYKKYDGKEIIVKSSPDKAAVYKVFAYSVDKAGNRSAIASHRIVVDELNYYLTSDAKTSKTCDGSFLNPFTSLEQALAVINEGSKETRLHVSGTFAINGGQHVISKDCRIYGNGSRLVFNNGASLKVDGASVYAEKCSFEKTSNEEGSESIFVIDDGKLVLNGCEVIGIYSNEGNLIESNSSRLDFSDCGFTVQTGYVSTCVFGMKSDLVSNNNRFTSIGDTAINVRLLNGTCTVKNDEFTSIGTACRGIDLVSSRAKFGKSTFNAQSDVKLKSSVAVNRDGTTTVSGMENIVTIGY